MPTPQSPGTNKFRCEACGRHFNTPQELTEHERECAAALLSRFPPGRFPSAVRMVDRMADRPDRRPILY